jgi:hypothetical protein
MEIQTARARWSKYEQVRLGGSMPKRSRTWGGGEAVEMIAVE